MKRIVKQGMEGKRAYSENTEEEEMEGPINPEGWFMTGEGAGAFVWIPRGYVSSSGTVFPGKTLTIGRGAHSYFPSADDARVAKSAPEEARY